jgi:UDP-N-acetylmuramate: L-alanyl-gamma-D-glutamyl-meso-diaminopimelate ligase
VKAAGHVRNTIPERGHVFNILKESSGKRNQTMHLHFIGVCGTAMAAVAAELHRRGVRVTGSDQAVYPPMSTFLAEAGVRVLDGFRAENLEPGPDLVVVGNAVSRGNPEVEALLDRRLPYCSLPEFLHWEFLAGKESVVVSGTHGKTTTAALCAWLLRSAGRDPSWFIGGVPVDLGRGFHLGGGAPFVLEGDEYDTAFFDKRAKFLHYAPRVLLLNNLEYDHADIYDDLEAIRRSFRQLLRLVPRSGLIVANVDDPEVRALLLDAPSAVVTYSVSDESADWFGAAQGDRLLVRGPAGSRLELRHHLVGRHQCWNLLAATAAAAWFGVDAAQLEAAAASFRGVKRRAELRGEAWRVPVYDDFAHHPTAIRSTLEGFRDRFPERRIWALVEPRSNTMRRRIFQAALSDAFGAADEVCLRAVPNPEKVTGAGMLDVERLAADLRERGTSACVLPDAAAIAAHVLAGLRPGDVIVVMSNGGFEGIHDRLLQELASRSP